MRIEILETKYYGIHMMFDPDTGWWIVDDVGGERYYDHQPTGAEIDLYRACVIL